VLTVRSLVVHRGGKGVLHGIDLDVPPGQITALVGANGAGKSSTVMAIAGAIPILSGTIVADGKHLQNCRPEWVREAGVSVVPEGHRVLGDLSVMDNLRVAASGLALPAALRGIDRVLEVFPELRVKLDSPGRALSGGQKQMVSIAQALVAHPRYLVVDELSLGLAPTVVKRLTDVVKDAAASGVGVLLIEQFTSLALSVSNLAFVLERGRVAFSGTADELCERPEILHSSYLASKAVV
jgi:branched-chain amino acid transport system ATP-binding protein